MQNNKKFILILVIPFIILAVIYVFLPPIIPRQFNFKGEPTSYMEKEFIFLFGFLPIIIYGRYSSKK